jgi:CubicO group peptidase (beta-lactamase class C family)
MLLSNVRAAFAVRIHFSFIALSMLAFNPAQAQWTILGDAGPEPTVAGNPGTPRAEYAQFDAIMQQFMQRANVPNAQLAVAYEGKLLYNRAYTNVYNVSTNPLGRARQTAIPTNPASANTYDEPASFVTTQPNTRFRVASLSKFVTGLAIQQLVLDGKLQSDMSDSAYDILREGTIVTPFDVAPADARMLNVTVKHLITHEAGFDRDCVIFPVPLNCHPSGQPAHIVDYPDAMGFVKPIPYPYSPSVPVLEWVRSCERHLAYDLPQRLLHYAPGSPPAQGGGYYQYYTNTAFCWAHLVIEIKSGMTYEDYVRQKVLSPLGIDYARIANADVRDRWDFVGSDADEINFYYDQPLSADPNATLRYEWCAIYTNTPIGPCVVPRPVARIVSDTGGAGGWVFSAQEYVRMILSVKDRLRAPYLLDFPASNVSGSDAAYIGPQIDLTANSQTPYYTIGAYAYYNTNSPVVGWSLSHSGSFPGTRANFVHNRRGWTYVVTMNTNPEWGLSGVQRNCSTTTQDRVKAWCQLHGNNTLPASNTGSTVPATTSNSISAQLNTMWANSTQLARMQSAPDIWVDEAPAVCSLDVNNAAAGNGTKNPVADGLMILRAMNNLRGAPLAESAIGATSNAATTYNRAEKNARDLVSTKVVDLDGDGIVQPARDGMMLLRAMMGLKGTAVTDGLPAPAGMPTRSAWDGPGGMREYVNARCAAGFL